VGPDLGVDEPAAGGGKRPARVARDAAGFAARAAVWRVGQLTHLIHTADANRRAGATPGGGGAVESGWPGSFGLSGEVSDVTNNLRVNKQDHRHDVSRLVTPSVVSSEPQTR
jgi:hypothetical protein